MAKAKKEQKAQARFLYFTTAGTQKEIASTVGVTEKTMSAWVRNGRWPELKRHALHSPREETHRLYEELRQINKRIAERLDGDRYCTKDELDAKSKIIAMITSLKKNTEDNWRNVNPELALIAELPEEKRRKFYEIVFVDGDGNEVPLGGTKPPSMSKLPNPLTDGDAPLME